MTEIDWEEIEESAQVDQTEGMRRLSLMCEQLRDTLAVSKALEQQKKENDAVAKKLSEELIPNLMREMGYNKIELLDGTGVQIRPGVYSNISLDREDEAFAWLRSNNHGSIIKHEIKMNFGMGEDDNCSLLKSTLDNTGQQYTEKEHVHPQTLKAWARKEIDAGRGTEEFRRLFGIHEVRETVLK